MTEPLLYCINLARATARRARMERRLAHHGLLERTQFVQAVEPSIPADDSEEGIARAGCACTGSHLKVMRLALETAGVEESGFLVSEDDALFHNDFANLLPAVLGNLPEDAPMCMLGYLVAQGTDSRAGVDPALGNLFRLEDAVLWGSQLYWMSAAYARRALDEYDQRHEELPVSEVVIQAPGGFASHPPLALQDAIDSTIRPPEQRLFHLTSQRRWRYEDYAAAEHDDLSPLAKRPSIGLAMIVRDEAQVIERCLESVAGLIDTWTICDTGSTDGTPELIEAALAGIPGTLHHTTWHDFGANRSELMKLASGSAQYLLLLDADMTIESAGQLPELSADAYLLRHAGSVEYLIPRLVRADRRWWYEGSTHEYLATEGEHSQAVLEELVVEHHGDGGSRVDKLERDERLLRADLERDPGNVRAVFYLAQTLRDAGRDEEAIELYQRRVEMGGWHEEVFYAAYQAAVIRARSDADAAIPMLLDAIERGPQRAEPLCELARLCRDSGRFESAYEFARRGLELPYPDDWLFVHRDVYEWGLAFELSIAAQRLGRMEEAREAQERLLAMDLLPGEIRDAVLRNRRLMDGSHAPVRRQAELLIEIAPSTTLGEIALSVEPDWPRFNPTIAADGDGFRMIVRTANYRLVEGRYEMLDGDGEIRTLNYVATLDAELAVTSVAPLEDHADGPPIHPSPVLGFEDCRLFQSQGHWYALATVRDRNPEAVCEIALLGLDGAAVESVRVLPGPSPERHEKNWMPFADGGGAARLVYSCGPTRVLSCDPVTGATELLAELQAPAWAAELRGGSQGVAVDGGTLFVVHEVSDDGGRAYYHRLVLIDHDYRLNLASQLFRFSDDDIELCAGLARRGDELVMTFGVGDRSAGIAVCAEDELLRLLLPLDDPRLDP